MKTSILFVFLLFSLHAYGQRQSPRIHPETLQSPSPIVAIENGNPTEILKKIVDILKSKDFEANSIDDRIYQIDATHYYAKEDSGKKNKERDFLRVIIWLARDAALASNINVYGIYGRYDLIFGSTKRVERIVQYDYNFIVLQDELRNKLRK